MKRNWVELFGDEIDLELKNEERKYFGLDEIQDDWDQSEFFSKTNSWYKRVIVFWEKETIKKVIIQENLMIDDSRISQRLYHEFDTTLKTENREFILPLTKRGKKKKLSSTNILAIMPFGCQFYCVIDSSSAHPNSKISVTHPRNNQRLAIGEDKKIRMIQTPKEFREFIEAYLLSCPEDYFEKINRLRTEKHKTIKYRVGDVFRVELDRFHYSYGIITGEVKKIIQWNELPGRHSLRSLMMVPLLIRYYKISTTNKDMKVEDLKNIPLSGIQICADNDIIWGTHPIIGHKELSEEDINFNLICTKYYTENKHTTVFTQDSLIHDKRIALSEAYHLYVEWGTASTNLLNHQLSKQLKLYLENYYCPFAGVATVIHPRVSHVSEENQMDDYKYKYNLLEEHNLPLKEELFVCLGLDKNADFDDFAKKFGGLSKKEILQKIKKDEC